MAPSDPATIVLDTSILLNFVKVGHVGLLGRLGPPVLLLDQVLAEVIRPDQRTTVDAAIAAGVVELQGVTDLAEVTLFAELQATGRLGVGECAVLAVALNRKLVAGLQDRRAQAEGRRRLKMLQLCQTEDLVATLIRAKHLTLKEADRLLVEWATHHRFRSKLTSFRELL